MAGTKAGARKRLKGKSPKQVRDEMSRIASIRMSRLSKRKRREIGNALVDARRAKRM